MRKENIVWIAVIVLLQACGASNAKEESATAKPAEETKQLETFILSKGQLESEMRLPGELLAFQQVDLYAKVSSFVKKIYVDVGSEVVQGQLLAALEAPELNAQLLAAESKLKAQEALYLSSKSTYGRLNEAAKTPGTVSQNDLDIALSKQNADLAQLDAAKAAYREVQDTRNYLEIRAPFSGVISTRNVSAGAYVGPSGKGSEMPIFSLQEQKKLRLAISVPEIYIPYITHKRAVDFTVRSYPNETFTATVARLAGALDTRLRAQRTEMDVTNTDKRLLPGMVAEVKVPLVSSDSLFVVPSGAVLNSSTGIFVIKITQGKNIWVPVKKGTSSTDSTEIFGKIVPGDTLVKKATEEIRDGDAAGAIKF